MKRLLERKVLPETVWMVAICGIDVVYTLIAVHMGWAKESNPLLAGLLQRSDQLFLAGKGASFMVPLVTLELLRDRFPDLVVRSLRWGIAGYLAIYVLGSLALLHHPI
ncbi:MAG TPA: DUF5658 family protein [Fimbriimonas sp.]|nr:DUF5658 family protein [Fimbriimonas sp.]